MPVRAKGELWWRRKDQQSSVCGYLHSLPMGTSNALLIGETGTKNKKVLLRERKRHTARCVANTPYVVLTGYPPREGSGYPPGGVPSQVPPRGPGTPPGGYPVRYPRGSPGTPPGGTQSGTPGGLGTHPPGGVPGQVPGGVRVPPGGYPVRYPPGGTRTPPPPLWTDKHLWKQYLPVVLRTRAVIMPFMYF